MASDIDRAGVARAYERWAPVYDLVFGKVFDHGRQSTIAEADKIGGRILDVGVGTGLSLSDYSRTTKLCGVDISEPMLRKAQQRVRALGLGNVEALAVMDAKNLAFADSFFDAVVAQYVITAVPDPEATLDDFIRVLKPGGELILVNHIGAESGPRRIFELAFAPLARRLGWRPEFPWASLGASGRLGRETRRRQPDRAPPDAADGAFLADPLPQVLERDDFSSNRHPALSFCLSMISGQTLRVCPEGKPVPAHGVVARGHAFPDHALKIAECPGGTSVRVARFIGMRIKHPLFPPRPDRTARAGALHELRADAADAEPRRGYAGGHDHRPARRAAWRQIGKVRRRAVSARGC